MAGASSLGVPRFRPANTTTEDSAHSAAASHIVICPAVSASTPESARCFGNRPSSRTSTAAPRPWQKPVSPTIRPRDSSPGVSASTVPNMVPMAATPTEKNSAQPASCGTVRAIGYQRNPAASHRNPKAYTERRPILSASAPNGATRHSASSSLAKLSAETVRPCRWGASPRFTVSRYGCM